jgi:coxsackievirus/adenovirus receptor
VCSCKPGVGGDKCNECLPGFYNLRTTGCIACDCHPYGSLSQNAQCELTTGQCPCKPGAIGRHCDSCSSGFFNVTQGCPTCQCNGHSSQCDVVSGVCSGCDDNTEGSNCQSCLNGFFGDATRGTATDCQPCPCPGIALSSRFSNTCKLKQDGTAKCTNCSEGHDGDNCEFCSDGYFGDPMGILGTPSPCVKCDCSGNVNETAKNNCNNLTGICSQCLYNTAGDHCEFCADGYYGSALAKNCTACGCDPVGAAGITCLEPDGHCICRLNVMGQICDSCLAGYYNLTSDGCQECLCNPTGSQSLSCDKASGNCQCKPGVWGGKCDQCQPGFYGLSSEGCTG